MLFDVLSDILFNKRGDQLQSVDNEVDINPYMLNRWISMHSPECAFIVNEYNNKWWSVLQNKNDWYRFNLSVIPRYRPSKLSFIKKSSKEKKVVSDDNKVYEILAHNLELSIRDVKSYISDNNIDISTLKKTFKNDK